MAILSDHNIQRAMASVGTPLKIGPLADEASQIQPCSVDLRLGSTFKTYRTGGAGVDLATIAIDPKRAIPEDEIVIHMATPERPFILEPLQFALAHTIETITIPTHLLGLAVGKSGIARLGLQVECAGLCDPGFTGQVTLELFNMAPRPILLYPGMKICQLTLWDVRGMVEKPYGRVGSKYQNQTGATESRFYQEF